MYHIDCFALPNLLVDISAKEFNLNFEIFRDNEVSNADPCSLSYWKSQLEGVLLICMEDSKIYIHLNSINPDTGGERRGQEQRIIAKVVLLRTDEIDEGSSTKSTNFASL